MKSKRTCNPVWLRIVATVAAAWLLVGVSGCTFLQEYQAWRGGKAPSLGWLGGVGAGQSKRQFYDSFPGDSVDLEDTASYVFGGYRVGPATFAAGYTDLGSMSAVGAGNSYTDKLSADAFAAMAILNFSATPELSPFVMAGWAHWNQKVRYNDSFGPFTADESGTDPAYGGGVAAKFGPGPNKWMVHAFWLRFEDVGDLNNSGHQSDIDMIGIGGGYQFSIR